MGCCSCGHTQLSDSERVRTKPQKVAGKSKSMSHKPSVVFQGLRAIFEPLRQVALRFDRRSEPQIKLGQHVFGIQTLRTKTVPAERIEGETVGRNLFRQLRMSHPAPPIIHLSRIDAGEPAPTAQMSVISRARLKLPPMLFRSASCFLVSF